MEYNHLNKEKENDFCLNIICADQKEKEGVYDDATQN